MIEGTLYIDEKAYEAQVDANKKTILDIEVIYFRLRDRFKNDYALAKNMVEFKFGEFNLHKTITLWGAFNRFRFGYKPSVARDRLKDLIEFEKSLN